MHNAIRVDDYIFDTVALRDAFQTIDVQAIPFDVEYTDAAASALFDYFCDWSPARKHSITTPSSEILSQLSKSEREAQFNSCCEALAEALQEGYSIEAQPEDIARIARLLDEGEPDLGQYDFLLRYVWQYSAHLRELNPDKNPAIHDIQDLLNVTRNLPREFQQTKTQQSPSGPVNQIRARVLEQFHADGEISVDVLETAKTEIIDEGDAALNAWNNYTIIAQIYYDYVKPRLKIYLRTLADRIQSEFTSLSLTTNLVDFQGSRNFVSDFAWIAVYPQSNGSQKHSHQLYLGIKGDSVKYGLHVGDELREEDWKNDLDIDRVEQPGPVAMSDVLEKLNAVKDDFLRLENIDSDDQTDSPGQSTNYYWATANPSIWSVDEIADGSSVLYTAYNDKGNKKRLFEAFSSATPGDRVLFYESTPVKEIVAEGTVIQSLQTSQQPSGTTTTTTDTSPDDDTNANGGIRIDFDRRIDGISWDDLTEIPDLEDAAPIENRAQGSLFPLTETEFETILALEDPVRDGASQDAIDRLATKLTTPEIEVAIPDSLYFDNADRLRREIEASLRSGKHIIFTGPPGTGKTKLSTSQSIAS